MPARPRISVAGVCVQFIGDSEALAIIERRYGDFFVPEHSEKSPDARVELDLYPPPANPWAGELEEIAHESEEFQLRGPGIEARMKADASWAHLRAPRTERSIDGVLRYLLSQTLLDRGGLMVHASAVVEGESAYVFAGPSGSGKSTLAEHLGGRCLGDEAIVLTIEEEGVVAHATPYWRAKPGSSPVAALLFNKRGDENRIRPLSQGRALAKLLSCIGPHVSSALPLVVQRSTEIVAALAPALLDLSLASKEAISSWLQGELARL